MDSLKGRKSDQKMKPYLVYQYLLKNTDENHYAAASEIVEYLKEACGIEAEKKSVYKDIEAINKAVWILENDVRIDEIDELDFEDEKIIVYDKHFKGFYVRQRKYEASDIRLIAECIYSSKYISQDEAERLVDIMKEFISDNQASEIRMDALVMDRVRTLNKSTIRNISTIYDAMSKKLYGEKHIPEKINFQYLKYSIDDINHQIERSHGILYTISPYKLIINDGNYYLLAFDDYSKSMRTYRVDRMKRLKRIGEPREGEEEFLKVNLKNYTKRVFTMYAGEKKSVRIRFDISLLDAIVDRFGRGRDTNYIKESDNTFIVSTEVEVSSQFFGWICGFGKRAEILAPVDVKEEFCTYLNDIIIKYATK